jgi:hypothetical protein
MSHELQYARSQIQGLPFSLDNALGSVASLNRTGILVQFDLI